MPPGTDSVAPLDAVKVEQGPRRGAGHRQPRRRRTGGRRRQRSGHSAASCRRAAARHRHRRARLRRLLRASTVREPRIRVVPLRGSGMIAAAARLVASDIERRGGAARLDEAGARFRRRAGGGKCRRHRGDRRHRQRPQRRERADAGARGTRRRARHGARARRNRRVWICRTAAGAAAAGAAGCGAGGLAYGRAAHAGSARRRQSRGARSKRDFAAGAQGHVHGGPRRSRAGTRKAGRLEPLAAKYLPLSSLARSDGWIWLPADSEGYAAGAPVHMRAVAVSRIA